MEHAGPLRRQLQHFIIGDLVQMSGVGHDSGVRSVNTVHIRVDLAQFGPECRRQRHSAGVAAAPAQGRNIPGPIHSLKARDQYDPVLIQLRLDPLRIDPLDPGVPVDGGGLDPHLPGGQGHAGQAHGFQRHGTQGYGDLLACGQQHIHFPLGGMGIDLLRLGNEVIRGVSLCGKHHQYIVALQISFRNDTGNVADPLCVPHTAAAEFLYDQAHGCSLFASDCRQSIEILPTGSRVHSIIRGKLGLGNQSSTRIFASVGR